VTPAAEIQNPVNEAAPAPQMPSFGDDIVIAESYNKKGKKEKAPKSAKPPKPPKPEKPQKPKKEKSGFGLFGGSKKKAEAQPQFQPQPQQIILGAAARQPVREFAPAAEPAAASWPPPDDFDEGTQILNEGGVIAVRLRLVGNPSLPASIAVSIDEGRAFTIGRFDVSVGRQQSNFEFDKTTKAVSRRHAAIERSSTGYVIVDLASSAGTFVNGQKLTPSVPFKLESGFRVSFGNAGADYVFEG
jgi:hypothetical protein